jgi:hypothetical protein
MAPTCSLIAVPCKKELFRLSLKHVWTSGNTHTLLGSDCLPHQLAAPGASRLGTMYLMNVLCIDNCALQTAQ